MSERNLYKMHADICHILAHPKRLEVITCRAGHDFLAPTPAHWQIQAVHPIGAPAGH